MAQADSPNKAGRPTKYDPEFVEAGYKYAEGGWVECKHNHPSVIGFARKLRVARSTIYKWAEEHPEFSDTLEHISSEQEFVVLDKALIGEYVAPMAKLALHNHGYSDKVAQDVTSSDGSMKPTVIELVGVPSENAAEDS
jgi:hypothetical protein